MQNDLI